MYLSASRVDRSDGTVLHWFFFHTFRMQLFFLSAGFFARPLVQRRGVAGSVRHRLLRVALPLGVGWLILYPCVTVGVLNGQRHPFVAWPFAQRGWAGRSARRAGTPCT